MTPQQHSLSTIIALSVAVHLCGAGCVFYLAGTSEQDSVEQSSIRVALGSLGASAGAEAPQTPMQENVPQPVEPPSPEPTRLTEPDTTPVSAPMPVARPEAEPEPEPEPVPKPEPLNELPPVRQSPSAEDMTAPAQTVQGNQGESGTGLDQQPDTQQDENQAGYRALMDSYDASVLAHLARFKSYPARARMRGEEGEVRVELEIDRNGQLVSGRILSGSGSRRLDNAALNQLNEAEPYPRPPEALGWQTRTYRTNMRYSLRDN
ncbi:energy transducer TonB [Ponticaulis sp.]|uniref:energy transducer TonB n=1 Tax=Ponticaulis sp. TaxID=2020902 RepID=UPI000B693478|nr:energy transducer TonB [Ponticaulis sp.]MAI89600.1 hypothetical protein [Ponticaulis sp.]OUY00625.1 MAG: hypothetical protein CBB65_04105 [Hyphomonadaceae bacterium TMED5]|tara:strand:- start:7978 stop:8766 length:789 start_codon:yes stop_codon:yes gene_type:complete